MRVRARSNTALFRIGGDGNQAYLPTFQDAPRENPRFSRAQPHPRRTKSAGQSARQGPAAPRTVAANAKRFGLDASRRLRQKAQFERLLSDGTRRSLDGFTFYIERRDAGQARLGMLVTRKHAARATDRNGIKRCIREAFRLEQHGLDCLDILVRPPYGARASAGLIVRLRSLFGRLSA
jgi:ribonuclease P protein component